MQPESRSAATVYVVMECDYEEQRPVAVYVSKDAAEQEAKRLEALVPPRTTPYADDVVRYAYRVEEVEFHA